jgi:hypothetical protein
MSMSEVAARRWFRGWVIGTLALLTISMTGTVITYLDARPLLVGRTRPALGQVVAEESGFLGVRNFVTFTYRVDGEVYEAAIPVKGRGFVGPGLKPYYYEPGDSVVLAVESTDPSAVRTRSRWVPAVYNWAVVLGFSVLLLLLIATLRGLVLRANREALPRDDATATTTVADEA